MSRRQTRRTNPFTTASDFDDAAHDESLESDRLYRRARSLEKQAARSEHHAAEMDRHADWLGNRRYPEPEDAENAEACRRDATSSRLFAERCRLLAPEYRAWAREAMGRSRHYSRIAAEKRAAYAAL